MNRCPGCNKIILSDYKYCPRCGKPLRENLKPYSEKEEKNITGPSGTSDDSAERGREGAVKFFELARSLSDARNIDQLLNKIGAAAEKILNAERSAILLLDEKKENLYFKTATGEDILKKITIPLDRGLAGWIASNQKPEIVNDPYSDSRFSPETDKKTGYKTRSIAGAPMIAGEELIGVVEVLNKKDGPFKDADLDTLRGFAGLAAVTILNTRLSDRQENIFSNILDYLVMGSEALSGSEPTPEGHTWEMARLAVSMGREMKLEPKKIRLLHKAAMLHDIGFLGLQNPRLLGFNIEPGISEEARFKLHPVIGSEMIKSIKSLEEAAPFIANHHRYRNGEGFPENISSGEVTPQTEIISILEDYFIKGEKNKINLERYSEQVKEAFLKIVEN